MPPVTTEATTAEPATVPSTTTEATATDEGIKVNVNGNPVAFDQEPIIINGRTMVPLRAIFEALDAQVEWNPDERQITSFKDNIAVLMTIDSNTMTLGEIGGNATEVILDAPPVIVNSRTLVPARAVAEAFNCTVDWDSATKTVSITG